MCLVGSNILLDFNTLRLGVARIMQNPVGVANSGVNVGSGVSNSVYILHVIGMIMLLYSVMFIEMKCMSEK